MDKKRTSGEHLKELRREQRRRLEEARRAVHGADVPGRESTVDTTVHVNALIAEALGHAGEYALESATAGLLGAATYGIHQGYEVAKAIGETQDANAKEAKALGARHALSVLQVDLAKPDNRSIQNGEPLNEQLIKDKINSALSSDKNDWFRTLAVENTRQVQQQYDEGVALTVGAIGASLRIGSSPEERKVGSHAGMKTLGDEMAKSRRAWEEKARQEQQRANARAQRMMP
ncbi:hypothetical protein JOE57_003652 [Microlunatus panaciterrae]|uniref:Uncharacterized protein n=1 Tax=Microlunatus panaciterrae TaxID=400768 RepID=A0ABS2RRE2_9ACTN|nr:hypothetical protein [Microlunatus panaciterrae]MBM7800731.1 hypothetical protein [Microlunatus panaciterrae]